MWKVNREQRKPIAKAISELLEMRHEIFGTYQFLERFRRLTGLSDNDWAFISNIIKQMVPNNDGIKERYNSAVDQITEINPLLGFKLRSKDIITDLEGILDNVFSFESSHSYIDARNRIEGYLYEIAKPALEELILELAKHKGLITKYKIKKYLNLPIIPTKELDGMFTNLMNQLGVEIATTDE